MFLEFFQIFQKSSEKEKENSEYRNIEDHRGFKSILKNFLILLILRKDKLEIELVKFSF